MVSLLSKSFKRLFTFLKSLSFFDGLSTLTVYSLPNISFLTSNPSKFATDLSNYYSDYNLASYFLLLFYLKYSNINAIVYNNMKSNPRFMQTLKFLNLVVKKPILASWKI